MSPVIEFSRSQDALRVNRSRRSVDEYSTLRVTSERTRAAVIVTVGGEVDASNEDAWKRLLTKMAATAIAPEPFVVDVRNVGFMGWGAVRVLGGAARRCQQRRVSLVSDQPIVNRMVAAGGLRPVLSVYPTVAAALAPTAAQACGH